MNETTKCKINPLSYLSGNMRKPKKCDRQIDGRAVGWVSPFLLLRGTNYYSSHWYGLIYDVWSSNVVHDIINSPDKDSIPRQCGFTLTFINSVSWRTIQSTGHPHPKPIKLRQAGWPLLSMFICCSGVMTTPVVSGCHWGPNGFHMTLRNIQLYDTSRSHWGAAGISTLDL